MALARDDNNNVIQAPMWAAYKTLAIGATSAQSAALGTNTRAVRLCSTSDCYVQIGSNPTATATSAYLPAGKPEIVSLAASTDKIAALQVTAAGVLSIVEIS
jgi:hypothetical protein